MYTIKGTLSLYIPIDFTSSISIFCPNSVTETIKDNKALTVGFLLGLSLYSIVRYTRSPWRHLPPGPRGIPILGNALQLGERQWLLFSEFHKTYGDITYLNAAGQPIVVLNSQKVAADLLDRRASIYSDRPQNIVASDIMTGGLLVVFTRYGDVWRRMRKAAHEALNKQLSPTFHYTQLSEALVLVSRIMRHLPSTNSPPSTEREATSFESWDKHVRRAAASSVMSIVYGIGMLRMEGEGDTVSANGRPNGNDTCKKDGRRKWAEARDGDSDDAKVAQINDFVQRLTRAAYPGAHWVESFPWMIYIPSRFARWKHQAEEWYRQDSAMFEGLFDRVRTRMAKNEEEREKPSLSATLIKDSARHNLSERENAWLAGTMYAAGSETTSGVISWWMLAMVTNPLAQRRAQAEIDAVVGRSRPPSFKDFDSLVYVRATVKEALRWRMVDPVGLPHRLIQDDWYDGHYIPKGTIVIANVWGLNRDVDLYGADAGEFRPERFVLPATAGSGYVADVSARYKERMNDRGLEDEYASQGTEAWKVWPGPADTKDEGHLTFGFGRRLCVGRHVANNTLFIDIAMMLWAFNIERMLGTEIDVDGCIEDGLVVRPIPFECHVTPRFPEVASIIEQEREMLGLGH